jgi:glycogen debranching enzyme
VASLATRFGHEEQAGQLNAMADLVYESFNRRFWNEEEGLCFDVIADDGADASLRPNQLLAMSLPFAVLDVARHAQVLETIKTELMTPFGLRTRRPTDPAYHGTCSGDFVERDRAAHQGCVHPWLLGPYITTHLKLNGRSGQTRRDVKQLLDGCIEYIAGAGEGNLCEMFDGEAPHRAAGAIASAIGAAEILRAYLEDVLDRQPQMSEQSRVAVTIPKPAKRPISN